MAKETALEKMPDNEIAIVEDAGNAALDILNQHIQTIAYDPGFMKIKPNKGAKSFDAGALGTMDGPLECIILSVNVRRTLWTPDKLITEEQLATALQMMPTDIDKWVASEVTDWCNNRPLCGSSNNNGTKGEIYKIVDVDAPAVVGKLLNPPAKAAYSCTKCKWNDFGSDFKGGAGKACKESHWLLLYFRQEDMAATIALPPTSIKPWKEYKTSLPRQNFTAMFTSIATVPTSKGGYDFNVCEFTPVKAKSKIVEVEPMHLATLGEKVVYGGQEVYKLQALIAEFLEMEVDEEDNPNAGSGDIPSGGSAASEGNAPADF